MSTQRNSIPSRMVFKNSDEEKLYHSLLPFSGKSVTLVCPSCKTEYRTKKKSITAKGHGYCLACSQSMSRLIDITGQRYGNLLVIGLSHTDTSSSYWKVLCDCGNTHVAEKQNLKRGYVKSCGCAIKNNGGKFFGKDHPNWNPLLTDQERVEKRDTTENINWRTGIFERDAYRCILCNDKGKLNAHHLYGYRLYSEFRFDPRNGVSLCVEQHKEFHSRYPGKDVSPDMFLDFMSGRYYKSANDLNMLYGI
jgi:hypothetical protein